LNQNPRNKFENSFCWRSYSVHQFSPTAMAAHPDFLWKFQRRHKSPQPFGPAPAHPGFLLTRSRPSRRRPQSAPPSAALLRVRVAKPNRRPTFFISPIKTTPPHQLASPFYSSKWSVFVPHYGRPPTSPDRLPNPIKGHHTPNDLHRAHPRSPLFSSSP
jgi:hypothetical protein